MIINDYKDEDRAIQERDKLQSEIDALYEQIWPKQNRVNILDEAIENYNQIQGALDQ